VKGLQHANQQIKELAPGRNGTVLPTLPGTCAGNALVVEQRVQDTRLDRKRPDYRFSRCRV
jgi:hypothetical protein